MDKLSPGKALHYATCVRDRTMQAMQMIEHDNDENAVQGSSLFLNDCVSYFIIASPVILHSLFFLIFCFENSYHARTLHAVLYLRRGINYVVNVFFYGQ